MGSIGPDDFKAGAELLTSIIKLFETAWPHIRRALIDDESREPSVQIRKTRNGLTAVYGGKPLESVTYPELNSRLTKEDRKALRMLERSLSAYVDRIKNALPDAAKLSAAKRKEMLKELKALTIPMRADLLAILKLIQKAGFSLQDHYAEAYAAIDRLRAR
ncbi:MAG TPA: hypothetical protein VGO52_01410 [Hyphomonadaceae bacterium]|nr:hypothetical protein [Hyphomonadaceae bacterium]